MTRDRKMDDVFGRLLPSASQEQIEGARWRILEHVRAGAIAEPVSLLVGRLNHGDYHILLVLSAGERHGYAIMAEVAEVTEGATKFGPGTLYTSIKRLLTAGLIEESRNRPDRRINDEPRRYYRLTAIGQKVLVAESERLSARPDYARDPQIVRSI
jgi:DNA-binding PadR family transcriptional regulator